MENLESNHHTTMVNSLNSSIDDLSGVNKPALKHHKTSFGGN